MINKMIKRYPHYTIAFIVIFVILVMLIATYLLPQNRPFQPCMNSYVIVIKEKFLMAYPSRLAFAVRYFNKDQNKHYIMDSEEVFVNYEIGDTLTMYETCDGTSYEYKFYRIEAENPKQK